jgi:hypothetical protein
VIKVKAKTQGSDDLTEIIYHSNWYTDFDECKKACKCFDEMNICDDIKYLTDMYFEKNKDGIISILTCSRFIYL